MITRLAAILVVTLFAACGGSSRAPVIPTLPAVQWSDYSPDVRTRIDAAAAAHDCDELQDEFDVAEANDAATRTRTGHGNAALMAYIDYKMDGAGCYD